MTTAVDNRSLARRDQLMTAVPVPRPVLPSDVVSDGWSDLEASMRRRFSDLDIWSIRAAVESARAEYANARVRAYVHILSERDVTDRLREVRARTRSVRE